MAYTFDNTNLITGYIKELLKDFNLPTCPVLKRNEDISKVPYKRTYLDENYFVKKVKNQNGQDEIKRVQKYSLGQRYSNLTKNLILKSNYYDQYTHEYLGDYLRFIRDYRGLNLMTLYNCYSNYKTRNIEKYLIRATFRQQNNLPTYGNYVYHILPVKFNQTYTIFLESPVGFEVFLLFNNENVNNENLFISSKKSFSKLTKSRTVTYNTNIEKMKYRPASSVESIPFWKTFSPNTNNINSIADSLYWTQEENLRMVIKLPIWVNTSISVIEDNIDPSWHKVGLKYFPTTVQTDDGVDDMFYTKQFYNTYGRRSLLENYSSESIPFSDKLIEYLTNLAITPLDQVPGNIGNIQRKIYNSSYGGKFNGYYDIFDDYLRGMIFKLANKEVINTANNNTYKVSSINGKYKLLSLIDRSPDLIYYVDKDIEGLVNSL